MIFVIGWVVKEDLEVVSFVRGKGDAQCYSASSLDSMFLF